MNAFTPQLALPNAAPPDPTKHVKYTFGMVLGVDDFNQDFAFLSEQDRWLARALIGYGTVSGLRVDYETIYDGPSRGPRVSVLPGVALSPSGRLICVPSAQCTYLTDWLAANRTAITTELGSPPGTTTAYVVLCYRECPTDNVPIPGEPCRSEDELLLPSRLKADFSLDLRLVPPGAAPDQREEEAVRRFVQWLRQVPCTEVGSSLEDFLSEIRLASGIGAAVESPPSPPSSPPSSTSTCPPVATFMANLSPPASLSIPVSQAGEYLRAAFRVWTTELLPCWRAAVPDCGNPCGDPSLPAGDAECVMLARVDVPVFMDPLEDRLLVGPGDVQVLEDDRPYLLDLRLVQEWLLSCACECEALESPPKGSPPVEVMGHVVVAGGSFDVSGGHALPFFSYGGLEATPRLGSTLVYDLSFADEVANPGGQYVMTGVALTDEGGDPHMVEVIPDNHLVIRIRGVDTGGDGLQGFMLQITRVGGP